MDLVNKNAETSTTLFVNISKKPFDIFIKGTVVRHLEVGEQDKITLYMAQIGAKHLVDRILQEERNIPDSNRDTPERQSLFSRILPEISEEVNVKPLSPDEEDKAFKDRVEQDRVKYAEEFKTVKEEQKEENKELKKRLDKQDRQLEKQAEQIKELTKVGKPPKTTE